MGGMSRVDKSYGRISKIVQKAPSEVNYPYGRVPGNAQKAMLRAMQLVGIESRVEPQGYYAKHRHQYRPPPDIQRLVNSTECQRVHNLTARTSLQWIGSMMGVVVLAGSFFSIVAIVKKDEKFEKEVMAPVRDFIWK